MVDGGGWLRRLAGYCWRHRRSTVLALGGALLTTAVTAAVVGLRRIRELLRTRTSTPQPRRPVRPGRLDGRIAETGTHEELAAAGGMYASLWEALTGEPAAVA